MKIISPTNHGYLDYATVVLFLLAAIPVRFKRTAGHARLWPGRRSSGCDPCDRFSFWRCQDHPVHPHGWIERLVGPLLVLIPFILGFSDQEAARNFYVSSVS